MLFINSRAFNTDVICNGKSYWCDDTYRYPVYIVASEEYLRGIQIIFMLLESFSLAILSEIFIQIGYFRSYEIKQKWMFSS